MAIGNIDKINKIIALKYNLPEKVIKEINNKYWSDIRRELISLDTNSILIKNVGTFTISKIRIYRSISILIYRIKALRKKLESGQEYCSITKEQQSTLNFEPGDKMKIVDLIEIQMGYLKQLLICRNKLSTYVVEKLDHRKENYKKQNLI